MSTHQFASNDEEEELALALAISASLAESSNAGAGRSSSARLNPPPPPQPAAANHARSSSQPSSSYYPAVPSASGAPLAPAYPAQQHPHTGYPAPAQQPARSNAPASAAPAYNPAQYQPPASQYQQPAPSYQPAPSQPAPAPARRKWDIPPQQPPQRPAPAPQPAHQPLPPQPAASQPPAKLPASAAAAGANVPARTLYPDPEKCAGCGGSVAGMHLSAMSRLWHARCFVCGFCAQPVNSDGAVKFAIGTDGWPYHMDCFKHRFHPICRVCGTFVPERADGRVEYKEQPFWRHTYCGKHVSDGTPQCCACSQWQPRGEEYARLADGRSLCLTCLGSVVVDTRDAQPLYDEVMAFYAAQGMPLPERAPLMLVDGVTLEEYSDREGKDRRDGGPMFHVRGLTLATVYTSIPSIVRDPLSPGGAAGLGVSSMSIPLGARVTCNVTGVLVMYGLPRLLTGCIIAHELMHAWLRMRGVAGLRPRVEEGLCQLMAYVWVEQQAGRCRDEVQQRLASYFAYQIREDTSEVYGEGFRDAYDAFQQRGLTALVNDVMRRGRFD